MEIEFKNNKLKKLAQEIGFDGGYERIVVVNFRKRIQHIRAANDERDLYAMKSSSFEKLKGKRAGQYSMRLNKQWRLILNVKKEATGKIVVIIEIVDYH